MGRQIIRRIQSRTINGISSDGSPFRPYSASYIRSDEFKQAGKSAGQVDLRLSREMLNSMVVESTSPGSITIGFDSTEAAAKADYAENRTNAVQRKFFSVSEEELDEILSEFTPEDIPDRLEESTLSNIFSNIFGIRR